MSSTSFINYYATDPTEQKIQGFKNLPYGWDYGEGATPTDDTISIARRLNTAALRVGFDKTNAFPGTGGEIQVTAYHDSFYLEMTIELDGLITFVFDNNDQEIEYRKMTLDQVMVKIHAFQGMIWALSDLLTENSTTTPLKNGSIVKPSDPQVMGAAYQSLILSAYGIPAQDYAVISRGSTGGSLEHLLFFGMSQKHSSPLLVASSKTPVIREIGATSS